MRRVRQFLTFTVLFGIFQSVCCVAGNYSNNPFGFQLDKKTELEGDGFTKKKMFESLPEKNIIEKRRLLINNDDINSAMNIIREGENNEYIPRRSSSNYSDFENEKISDWGNQRIQFSSTIQPENSRNFGEIHIRKPFMGVKNSNHRYEWQKKGDFFDKSKSRWNEEKNFEDLNHDFRNRNHHVDRFGGVISDVEANREDRRGEIFNRRGTSKISFNDAETGNVKNYKDESVGDLSGYVGYSNKNYYNRNPNNFWNPNFYKPEKGVVINLNTECPTSTKFNNQLVHKFIFTPKAPVSTQSEFSTFQIPESVFISSQKMAPMYYLTDVLD